ncbi:discoidin domain-containing receptor 2 isoform X2 [Vespula squamosa]|uniref:Discoidin domain-containing receptor 2 isoform X2 n=1 Tax=Vespula squamosa TaxID=30214 RepID=A0ABD2AUN5_VESSQ
MSQRLRQDKGGGAWCPKNMVTKEGKEYLEVNLHSPRVLMSVRTQGRFGNGHGVEYTEEYFVEYWRPGFNKWVRWRNRRGTEVTSVLLIEYRYGTLTHVVTPRIVNIANTMTPREEEQAAEVGDDDGGGGGGA